MGGLGGGLVLGAAAGVPLGLAEMFGLPDPLASAKLLQCVTWSGRFGAATGLLAGGASAEYWAEERVNSGLRLAFRLAFMHTGAAMGGFFGTLSGAGMGGMMSLCLAVLTNRWDSDWLGSVVNPMAHGVGRTGCVLGAALGFFIEP